MNPVTIAAALPKTRHQGGACQSRDEKNKKKQRERGRGGRSGPPLGRELLSKLARVRKCPLPLSLGANPIEGKRGKEWEKYGKELPNKRATKKTRVERMGKALLVRRRPYGDQEGDKLRKKEILGRKSIGGKKKWFQSGLYQPLTTQTQGIKKVREIGRFGAMILRARAVCGGLENRTKGR